MPEVSIIIPVYNSEKYLEKCLDSVCRQSYKEIEIICVDDGSTDSTPEILKRYQAQDDRIIILTQKNQFAGIARNNGMKMAKGNYLVFWDADDFFSEDAIEKLYLRIVETGADICVCGGYRYYTDKDISVYTKAYLNRSMIPKKDYFCIDDIPENILQFTCTMVWNKMYKRSFIIDEGLQFQATRNGNDILFGATALCTAKKISYTNNNLIYYRKFSEGSLTASVSGSALQILNTWAETAENLNNKDVLPVRSFSNKVLDSLMYTLHTISRPDAFRSCVEWIKENGKDKLYLFTSEDEEYYFNKRHEKWLRMLLTLPTDDFHTLFAASTFMSITEDSVIKGERLRQKIKENNTLKKDNDYLKKQNDSCMNKIKELQNELSISARQNDRLLFELQESKERIDKIKASFSYKIGKIITWIPRRMNRLMRK